MEFRVNKSSEFPIYQQLKEQIKYFLLSGVLQPGTRVPTPKDLASYLQVNRNTVIAAYKELEKEGLLVTKHGQGTYVSEDISSLPDIDRKQALINLAREALEKTVQMGFGAEDLFTVVFNQAVLGVGRKHDLRAYLVECNIPDLQYYLRELQEELKIPVDGCLLSELPEKVHEEALVNADFVITTFWHVEDVKAILEPLGKEVIAIMAAPHLHVLMRIGQFPPGTRVGLICGNEDGACNMRRALESAGIQHLILEQAGIDEKESLNKIFSRVEWVVSSRVVIDEVKDMVPPGIKVMELTNVLDQAGLQMLKQYLDKKRS